MAPIKKTTKKTEEKDLNEQIRKKAYQIFKNRSEAEGDEFSDWLKAEKEIVTGRSSKEK